MNLPKLYRATLLLLALLVMAKPAVRIALYAGHTHQFCSGENVKAFAQSRGKYDVRVANQAVSAQHYSSPTPFNDPGYPGYRLHQPALAAVITARHLLNIHFRILPERKIFLCQGRLTI